MKTVFRLVLALTLLPPLLGAAGMVLSHLAGCSGMDHIEHCRMAGMRAVVAPLIACVWISVFVVPAGAVVLALLGLLALVKRHRAGTPGP